MLTGCIAHKAVRYVLFVLVIEWSGGQRWPTNCDTDLKHPLKPEIWLEIWICTTWHSTDICPIYNNVFC